jgi:uncharacterized integral membrane protein
LGVESSRPAGNPEALTGGRAAEARSARAGRYPKRSYLYGWTVALLTPLVLIVILIAESTRRVKVGWIFGYSHVSLVFLVLFTTILGWLLGIATSVIFRRRTRALR